MESNQDLKIITTTINKEPKIDKLGRAYGTGRRKIAVARVWIKSGTGKITVNGKDFVNYFSRRALQIHALTPLQAVGSVEKFDIYSTVCGGGMSGQAGAIRHGIARALDNYDPTIYHAILKQYKLLTRDSRMVESKKYGKHKSRRATQFVKR